MEDFLNELTELCIRHNKLILNAEMLTPTGLAVEGEDETIGIDYDRNAHKYFATYSIHRSMIGRL